MTNLQQEITFSLRISADEYLRYYNGSAKQVRVNSLDGRVLRFPANLLQRFVTNDGIEGVFALQYDSDNRFIDIKRI